MIVIYSKTLVDVLTLRRANAITLFPFVFLSRRDTEAYIINHEKIHIRQQLELLILPFYIWYGIEFLYYYIKHKNRYEAYLSISFEQEAYLNHFDFYYLENRKFWNHLNFFRDKDINKK